MKIGDKVYALGSPLGLENTLSEGIITGLRRYEEEVSDQIQINADISPGSSGGALVNGKGELIGITTKTMRGGQNLNFAIPVKEVMKIKTLSYVDSTENWKSTITC